VIKTDRLRLEPLGLAHVTHILQLHSHPLVAAWLGGIWTTSKVANRLEEAEARWKAGGFDKWAAFQLSDGAFVGRGGLTEVELDGVRVVEVGWGVLPEHWGNGYASEIGVTALEYGFTRIGLTDIVSFCLPDNNRSLAVMSRIGLTWRGRCTWTALSMSSSVPPR